MRKGEVVAPTAKQERRSLVAFRRLLTVDRKMHCAPAYFAIPLIDGVPPVELVERDSVPKRGTRLNQYAHRGLCGDQAPLKMDRPEYLSALSWEANGASPTPIC